MLRKYHLITKLILFSIENQNDNTHTTASHSFGPSIEMDAKLIN